MLQTESVSLSRPQGSAAATQRFFKIISKKR